jgi:hypothetical protein
MSYKYKLLPAQKEFLELGSSSSDIDVALYQGGYGSGKTFSGSLLGIILALKYPGIKGLVGAQTLILVRDTTLVSYFEHLERMGLQPGIDYNYLKAESKLVFSNKSEILFRHLEEPDKLKSLNLGFVELEEMSDIPRATFDMLLGRLRQAKKDNWDSNFKYRLFGHTNPQETKGWIYEYFVENKPDNYRRIIAPTTENAENLPKGFIESMKERYSEEYFKRNVLGEDMDFVSGLATKGFSRADNIDEEIEVDRNKPLYVACDFNTDPMCWYLVQHYNGTIYYLYEIVENFTDTLHMTGILAELLLSEGFKDHEIIITGDCSGGYETTKGNDFQIIKVELMKQGFTNIHFDVGRKNPPIAYRFNCWNNMMRDKNGIPHIKIRPECKYLIYDIENLIQEEGTGKPKKPTSYQIKNDPKSKYLTHPTDACGYVAMKYYPIKQEESPTATYQGIKRDVFGKNKYEYKIGIRN